MIVTQASFVYVFLKYQPENQHRFFKINIVEKNKNFWLFVTQVMNQEFFQLTKACKLLFFMLFIFYP